MAENKKELQLVKLESGWRYFRLLEQTEFFGATDGCPSVVDPQLGENIFGVSAQGVERHDQLSGNFWAAQFAAEQPEYFQLAFAQRFDDLSDF